LDQGSYSKGDPKKISKKAEDDGRGAGLRRRCVAFVREAAYLAQEGLFFGDANAVERRAVIYSIIESWRRNGVEAYTYLCDVLTRLPSMTNWQIKDITPKAWANSRKGLTPKAA
jgi:hypothetical protein